MFLFTLRAGNIFSLLSCKTYNLEIWSKSHYAILRLFLGFCIPIISVYISRKDNTSSTIC